MAESGMRVPAPPCKGRVEVTDFWPQLPNVNDSI